MNRDSTNLRSYLIADRIIRTLLESQSAGLVFSIDIGGSLFDSIAKNHAESLGHQFIGAPTLLRHRSAQRGKGLPARPADVVAEPTFFGRQDGSTWIEDECQLLESYTPHFVEIATRSIDSLSLGRGLVRLIHFGDPEFTHDQIIGAAKVLGRDRPVVTLYTKGLDKRALLASLRAWGYTAVDLVANRVTPESFDCHSGFGWIGLPEECCEDILGEIDADNLLGEGGRLRHAALDNIFPRQLRSRKIFGLSNYVPRLVRTIDADELVTDENCYPIESDGHSVWRWTGPCPRTRLSIPCPIPGSFEIEISVLSNLLQGGLKHCRVLVEGREVQAAFQGSEDGMIRFQGQLEERNYTGYMRVDLVGLGSPKRVGNDPRTLRINIQSVTVSPWQ